MGRIILLIIPGVINLAASLIVGILIQLYNSEDSLVNYAVVALIGISSFFYFISWL